MLRRGREARVSRPRDVRSFKLRPLVPYGGNNFNGGILHIDRGGVVVGG